MAWLPLENQSHNCISTEGVWFGLNFFYAECVCVCVCKHFMFSVFFSLLQSIQKLFILNLLNYKNIFV